MSADLPNYDAWKLATPPEYERPDECPKCGAALETSTVCLECSWSIGDEDLDAYDTLEEAEMSR